jgi:acetate kinase
MAGVDMAKKLPGINELIFVLNSGSSSLKFGMYYRGASDEEAQRPPGKGQLCGDKLPTVTASASADIQQRFWSLREKTGLAQLCNRRGRC